MIVLVKSCWLRTNQPSRLTWLSGKPRPLTARDKKGLLQSLLLPLSNSQRLILPSKLRRGARIKIAMSRIVRYPTFRSLQGGTATDVDLLRTLLPISVRLVSPIAERAERKDIGQVFVAPQVRNPRFDRLQNQTVTGYKKKTSTFSAQVLLTKRSAK